METEMEEMKKLDEMMFEMKSLLADDDDDHPILLSNNNNNYYSYSSYAAASSSQLINFSSSSGNDEYCNKLKARRASTAGRSTLQAREHVEAERKRRENLGQLFIRLSKVVPGLKKLDKASLLEDAISHLKALQERVSDLERETSNKNDARTRRELYLHNSSNNKEISESPSDEYDDDGAEIKVRVSGKHVLVEIHCKKQKGLMSRVPSELEKMHLIVKDMTIMPFGPQPLLHIALLAEMQIEFRGTLKEIVDCLQTIFNPNRSA